MTDVVQNQGGYVKIFRKETDSDIWLMPPIYHRVWHWLLLNVQFEMYLFPTSQRIGIYVLPGQKLTSIRKIAEGVQWSEWGKEKAPNTKTINQVLDWLESNEMIQVASNSKGTLITVVNWHSYNGLALEKVTASKHAPDNAPETNKKDKKEKNKTPKEDGENSTQDSPGLLFELWNEVVAGAGLSQVKTFSSGRDRKCRARLKELPLEDWRKVFSLCATTPFLCGANDRDWKADFDWIIKNADNAAKVLEGKYGGTGSQEATKGGRYSMFAGM